MVDYATVVQAVLFAVFAVLTTTLATVIGPTYDNVLVPELAAGTLYPSLTGSGSGSAGFLTGASHFSLYLVANLADPAIALVAVGVGLVYLGRSVVSRWSSTADSLLPRLIVAVVLANFSLPVADGILGIAGTAYPVIAGFDGGAWQHWGNLAGFGEFGFSWDNGALAFVLTFVMFSLVLLLSIAVAVRDALLGVLLVLLPLVSLLWPIPPLAPLTRRAWLMFGELAFLPCVILVPLELAVASPSVVMLLAYLAVALGAPSLISLAGAQLSGVAFPSVGGALTGGVQRGLASGSAAASSYARPSTAMTSVSRVGRAAGHAAAAARSVGAAPLPIGLPIAAGEFLGRASSQLLRHVVRKLPARGGRTDRFPAIRSVKRP